MRSAALRKEREAIVPDVRTIDDRRRFLVGRQFDFWLMGGASLIVWMILKLVVGSATEWAENLLIKIGFVATFLSFLVFQPHFIFTYRVAYGRGWSFTLRHWPQLLMIPALLGSIYGAAYFTYSVPIENLSLRSSFPQLTTMTYGQALLSLVLSSMFLMLGWHHSKQTFGCMMAYRRFDDYPVSSLQRHLLLGSMYSLWAVNVVVAQAADQLPSPFYGLRLFTLQVFEPIRTPVIVTAWLLVFASLFTLISKNWVTHRRLPSANFLIPLLAILVWWAPPFYQRDFYVLFSTVFHALQYWPFAVRYESAREQSRINGTTGNWIRFITVAALLGALPLLIPMAFDHWFRPDTIGVAGTSVGFFVIAVQTSLNIHHYFLDSVIWRFNQPEIRQSICGEPLVK